MEISIEISYYPLKREDFLPIESLIKQLHSYKNIKAKTNGMSTQVFGEYDDVMTMLTKELKKAFINPHSVIVMKVINAKLDVDYEV